MWTNFLQSLKSLLTRTRRSLCKTARLVGLRLTRSLSPYLLVVKFQDGTYLKYALLVPDSKLLEVVRLAQSHWMICLGSQWIHLEEVLDGSSPPSNATISSVRLRKLWWSEESVDRLLSAFQILPMNGCVMLRLEHGGKLILKEHLRIIV